MLTTPLRGEKGPFDLGLQGRTVVGSAYVPGRNRVSIFYREGGVAGDW